MIFSCVSNSSFSDVVLNTYGSLDYYVKLLNDNGISPNDVPSSGQQVSWDENLVVNQSIQTLLTANNTIYATLFGTPNQTIIPIAMMYKDTLSASYTASIDGETDITITDLQGSEVVQVIKEIKPLLDSEYTFTSNTGKVTLIGTSLSDGETLFVLYKKTINY
jgi:hypothetical protein